MHDTPVAKSISPRGRTAAKGKRFGTSRRLAAMPAAVLHMVWWRGVRIYLRLAHRLEVEGLDRLPKDGPFVLVANHESHLDALVLASQLRWKIRLKTHPIAAADTFFDSPASSALALTVNALPMPRGRVGAHALDELRRRLSEERCVYVLFPEGTRSRDGVMKAFKPGVGMFLAGTDVPAVPCFIRGTFEAMPATRRFPRFSRLGLRVGEAMTFNDVANDREGWTSIARRLEEGVRRLARQDAMPEPAREFG